MKKRKKKSNTPRHKRLSRISRLQAAKPWIPKYEGKSIVKGYSKHFAVNKLCAVKELQILGYDIDPAYIKQLKASEEGRQKAGQHRKILKDEEKLSKIYPDSDETFCFIAGYTPGGLSYGITWEQMEMQPSEMDDNANDDKIEVFIDDFDGDDIPF